MIKKQQKWIALLVTLTFAWLLQVSTMPLTAAGAAEQVCAAQAGQAPDFVEQEDSGGNQPKKKSILPVVLIGVGVVAVAAVLFLVVLKKDYDIVGSWRITLTGTGGGAPNKDYNPAVFTGTKTSGTYQIETYYDGQGTYTVDGKTVTLRATHTNYPNWVWNGEFTDETHISGTATFNSYTWNWSATKNEAAATSHPGAAASQGSKPVLE